MNSVFRKDVIQTLRLKRVAAMQISWLALLGIVVLEYWPRRGIVTLADHADDVLLLGLIFGQLVFFSLFVPGIAAVAFSGEREANTFELLYASPLSATRIIVGKALAALFYPTLLLVTGLPFLGLLLLRGAISADQLLDSYIILALSGILLSALSLTISAFCRRTSTAIAVSYLLVLVVCGASLVPAAIVLDNSAGVVAAMLHYARSLSPLAAALAVLRPSLGDFDGRAHRLESLWPIFVWASFATSMLCVIVLSYRLSRPAFEEGRRGGELKQAPRALWRRLLFGGGRRPFKPIALSNPLLVNEARINPLRSSRWALRIFYGCLATALGLALISLYGGTEDSGLLNRVTQILVAFQVMVLAIVSPALTSAAISSEVESETFELLRTSPLRPVTVFIGKVLPGILPAVLPIAALLPAYGTICYLDPGYLPYFVRLLPVFLLASIFGCAVGGMCSAWAARSDRATVASYLVNGALFLVPVVVAWAGSQQLSTMASTWISMPSPLAVALNLMNRSTASAANPAIWVAHLCVMGVMIAAMAFLTWARVCALMRRA